MTAVELVMTASTVVMSTSSCSTPVSSTNAPRVPEPSSRDMTVMVPSAANATAQVSARARTMANSFFILIHQTFLCWGNLFFPCHGERIACQRWKVVGELS